MLTRTLVSVLTVLVIAWPVAAQQLGTPTTLNALDACHTVQPFRMGTVFIQLTGATGSWTATVKGGVDGAIFNALSVTPSDSSTTTTIMTGNGVWSGPAYPWVQVCLTAWTSGSVVVTVDAAPGGGGGGSVVGDLTGDITVGTEYTESDIDASISGTALMFKGAANTILAAPGTTANGLLVDVSRISGTVAATVSGTVAATQSSTWSMQALDGTGNALTSVARGAQRALSVQLVDAAGAQIVSFGSSNTFGSAFPASGTPIGGTDGTNLRAVRVEDMDSTGGIYHAMAVNNVFRGSGTPVEAGTPDDPWYVSFPTGSTQKVEQEGTWHMRVQDGASNPITSAAAGATRPLDVAIVNTDGTRASLTDDAVHDAAAKPSGMHTMIEFDDTTPDLVDEGDAGRMRGNAKRDLYVSLRDRTSEFGAVVTTNGELSVTCANCSGSGVSHGDDAAFTVATDDVVPMAGMFDDASPDSVTEGDAGVVRMSGNRNLYVQLRDRTSERSAEVNTSFELKTSTDVTASVLPNGAATSTAQTAAQTSLDSIETALELIDDDQIGDSVNYKTSVGTTEDEAQIKATAGRLMGVFVTNTNAAARYFRCANLTAANTTPGSSTVFLGLAVPGSDTGAGVAANFGPHGIAFSTALTCWVVTGTASTDVTEVAANEIKWIVTYK